ncbi:conserved hypothetical protein [Trichormus variabilis ATCC 29413]|uniref:Uncharacterized protein n=2 Tax=Anabaena variabilis TaxID=264691 RepID=Q3MFK5_TRIV2|nr:MULTISPECIES: hypothetical protein [Nostocaceae]ABA20231.1 conserved hypothetical protein [Trichormus variabilis ATCC 29413]MBC1215085.1 hypothetical protein [Trichormus variabilis ARAD]MBC1258609.1 hypothetical protein [Trichormus variabilis V5]MBC1267668.1 hypothetical protein [Trichormus variabilis FSR]MBC1303377.1 hypothetical protein [Trichormus variabilis N2B]
MKKFSLFKVVPAALGMILASSQANLAQVPSIQINQKLPSDPLVLSGQSGGTVKSNCGNVAATPNQMIQVTEALPYLRLTVEGQGKPTLLIDGPGGRFCVLPDTYSGSKAELSGYWQPGRYLLKVGNILPGQHNYNLSISQEKLPNSSKSIQSR